MRDFYQGDVIKIGGFKSPFLVVSRNGFIKAANMLHVCPIVNDTEADQFHININTSTGVQGVAICEAVKMIDPEARSCFKIDDVSYATRIIVSDVIQSLFEYD